MKIFVNFYTGLLKIYRLSLAPLFASMGASCRFNPTCSHYSEEAVREFGLFRGIWLSLWRILRCNPFCPGGYDPIPTRKR